MEPGPVILKRILPPVSQKTTSQVIQSKFAGCEIFFSSSSFNLIKDLRNSLKSMFDLTYKKTEKKYVVCSISCFRFR